VSRHTQFYRKPRALVMSGVTDPHQPVERKLRITRSCLEVLAKFHNPVAIITRNRLVTRDIDLLSERQVMTRARQRFGDFVEPDLQPS
jgi:DNA repair photolyase